jgi:methionyl aminopeptidase
MEDDELSKYRQAGGIAVEVSDWSLPAVKPGAGMLELAEKIEAKIVKDGGGLAFPVNVCINDVAAHYTPKYNDDLLLNENDVVSIDLGVHVDGYVADMAYTVDLGGGHSKMVEVNRQVLDEVIERVKPGVSVRELGKAVYDYVTKSGFRPIENLTGHEVSRYDLHAGISIPNIPVPYDWKLEEGMALAIEPFVTDGIGRVVESRNVGIYGFLERKPTRLAESRMLLNEIEARGKLPFAERWYAKKVGPLKLPLAIQELLSKNIIKAYPTLHEKGRGVVSQFEHTVVVMKDGCEVITRQ